MRVTGLSPAIRLPLGRLPSPGAKSDLHASVELAVARCLAHLDNHLLATVPRDPEQPVPAPQAAPSPSPPDPTGLIRRLGHHYAGQPLTVSFDRTSCRLWLTEQGVLHPLARATTLGDAVEALRL